MYPIKYYCVLLHKIYLVLNKKHFACKTFVTVVTNGYKNNKNLIYYIEK